MPPMDVSQVLLQQPASMETMPEVTSSDLAADGSLESEAEALSSPDLDAAVRIGDEECREFTDHVMHFAYPEPPRIPFFHKSTASGFFQRVRRLFFGCFYNDMRTLGEPKILAMTRYSGLGPLEKAVERAIVRRQKSGEDGAAPVLAIGAGQRLGEAQLKKMFSDRIRLYESSPVYAELDGVIDEELPAAGIDEADIGRNFFELVYSFYGSMYGDDQQRVLQKVFDSLRVGGEGFLMWKITDVDCYRMADLMRRYASLFQLRGIDVSVETAGYGLSGPSGEIFHTVWLRKKKEGVDIAAILKEAELLDRRKDPSLIPAPTMRLSLNGPYLSSREIPVERLESIVKGMMESAALAMGIESANLVRKLQTCGSSTGARAAEQWAADFVRSSLLDYTERGLTPPLEYHVPLSLQVLSLVHQVIPILDEGELTLAEYKGRMMLYMARGPGR